MKTFPKIILVFAAVDWPIYMRQPMVYALAEAARKHDSTVVAVNRPLCPLTTFFRKPGRIPELFGHPRLARLADNLYLYHPRYVIHDEIANSFPPLEKLNLIALRWSYRRLQQRLGIIEPAPMIWFNYPHLGYVTRLFDYSFCIAEIYDNLTDLAGTESPRVRRLEKKMRARTDLLLTTSQKIHDKYAGSYRRSFMFGNGLERRTFERLSNPDTKPRRDIVDLPSPRLGYAGMISDRLDWKLISELAGLEPGWNFVFVGPLADPGIPARMQPYANVYFGGECRRDDIPSVLKSFDVGIMPYRDTPFFHFLNPLKFYEMAAAGLPSVASNIEELTKFPPELVRVVRGRADAWREVLHDVLGRGPGRARVLGPDIARRYIWEDMTSSLLDRVVNEWLPSSPDGPG